MNEYQPLSPQPVSTSQVCLGLIINYYYQYQPLLPALHKCWLHFGLVLIPNGLSIMLISCGSKSYRINSYYYIVTIVKIDIDWLSFISSVNQLSRTKLVITVLGCLIGQPLVLISSWPPLTTINQSGPRSIVMIICNNHAQQPSLTSAFTDTKHHWF